MSSVTSEDLLRVRILKLLYERSKDKRSKYGVHRSSVMEALETTEAVMDAAVMFLARNNLVKIREAHNVFWLWAKMTSTGQDAIENTSKYIKRFPFLKYLEK